MSRTIDEPCTVIDRYQAHKDSPHHEWPAAQGEEQASERHLPEQYRAVEELVDRIAGNVLGIAWDVPVAGQSVEHPAEMRPPEAAMSVIRIARSIGVLVMHTVLGDPFQGPLTGQRAAEQQSVLQPFQDLEAAVGDQPVVAERDPYPSDQPV